MPSTLSPQEFVAKWRSSKLRENAAYVEHFIDLCHLVGHPTPASVDNQGTTFTFQAGVQKQSGKQGWADVYKRSFFALEYKGKHADLDKAYAQLLQYREALENPPLWIVSDMERIVIHILFGGWIRLLLSRCRKTVTPNLKRHTNHHPKSASRSRYKQCLAVSARRWGCAYGYRAVIAVQ